MLGVLIKLSLVSSCMAVVAIQNLGGSTWEATGSKPPSTVIEQLPHTAVPGCVHTDWLKDKSTEQDLYYRFNDDNLKWLAESNWKYTLTFQANEAIMHTYEQWLVFEGVDTVAEIHLNGKLLGKTSNMFLTYRYNVTFLLQNNFNLLEVSFESAVTYSNQSSSLLPYPIPPACPPDVQHGFCHVNLMRKEQCSFSWDWGPASATQGIWKPVYLLSLNYAVISEATASFDWESMNLEVDVQFLLVMFANHLPLYGNVAVTIDELKVNQLFKNVTLPRTKNELTEKKFILNFSKIAFEKWWPNGYGSQKLYNISVRFDSSRGFDSSSKHFLFGFRKVELVQEPMPGTEGLSFYFRINDLPIFAKGANWIPADAFKNRITTETYENLLKSAADAHMNMLRVWGGGIYEDDRLYELADKLGIMLWQDFMFACALYPSTEAFLNNVTEEISHVIWKLKHHPSIVIWAGNNENEAALSTNWYNTTSKFDLYKQDYVKLYVDTIGTRVQSMDKSRPFATSSPSNGKESAAEGGLAKNPYDAHYGDVHYYNYNDDCLDSSKYPATRFASEYGFQSWPSFETIQPVTTASDWSINSKWANHRQHHATGNQEMLDQIAMHFKPFSSDNTTEQFMKTIYMTQVMQGLCYKSQTEFYRRSRNETVRGAGHTMGALYWQLNDIWQAPTWSSIEFGGKWKVLHYFAAKFFAPVALVTYEDDASLVVYSASDISNPISATLVVSIHSWDGFDTTGTFNESVSILPHKSAQLFEQSTGYLLHYGGCAYKEVCYISVHVAEEPSIPTSYFFPVPFKDIEHLHHANITIEKVTAEGSNEFAVTISATMPALFVWLEASGIKGRFSDNAFVMDEEVKVIKFYSWSSNLSAAVLHDRLTIRSLNDLYAAPDDPIDDTKITTWLDNDTIKLVFAIVGLLFIAMASTQVICLVLRLNKPTNRPKNTLHTTVNSKRTSKGSANDVINSDLWSTGTSSSHSETSDRDGTAFLIKTKNKKNSKTTEFRFYII